MNYSSLASSCAFCVLTEKRCTVPTQCSGNQTDLRLARRINNLSQWTHRDCTIKMMGYNVIGSWAKRVFFTILLIIKKNPPQKYHLDGQKQTITVSTFKQSNLLRDRVSFSWDAPSYIHGLRRRTRPLGMRLSATPPAPAAVPHDWAPAFCVGSASTCSGTAGNANSGLRHLRCTCCHSTLLVT